MNDNEKYSLLKIKLNNIKNKIKDLRNDYNDLLSTIKEGLIIDNKLPEEEQLKKIADNMTFIESDLTNVISSVNNKI